MNYGSVVYLSPTLKFGYSEKATKFEKNLPLKIVAFSEYPNFNKFQEIV